MKKPFKFKDNNSNIEKLHKYALYKFSRLRRRIEYDEWGQFMFFKKDMDTHYFYYVKNNGDLYFQVFKKCISKMDKLVIKDFKHRIYSSEKLQDTFDKILKPLIG